MLAINILSYRSYIYCLIILKKIGGPAWMLLGLRTDIQVILTSRARLFGSEAEHFSPLPHPQALGPNLVPKVANRNACGYILDNIQDSFENTFLESREADFWLAWFDRET